MIYFNDLDSGISSDISKFADDTKVGQPIHSDQDASVLQVELDQLYEWAGKWEMKFNIVKCSNLSVVRNNPLRNYTLNGTPIGMSRCERDLGVSVGSDLRPRY